MNAHCSVKMRRFAIGASLAVMLVSCVAPTPAERITENPLMYGSLPAKQQLLVQNGQICNGMTPDAVYLAWGNPNTPPVVGESNGRKIERWVYRGYEPVPVMTVGGGFCHGPFGCYGATYPQMDTAYLPYDAAFVEFTDGKVTSWQSRQH